MLYFCRKNYLWVKYELVDLKMSEKSSEIMFEILLLASLPTSPKVSQSSSKSEKQNVSRNGASFSPKYVRTFV